ncbi:hypothetical protein ACHAWF_017053 [Thalassiosira exigua]
MPTNLVQRQCDPIDLMNMLLNDLVPVNHALPALQCYATFLRSITPPPMSETNDLSPYELARLERIKRNQERLRSLGLLGNNAIRPALVTPHKTTKKKAPRKRKRTTSPLPTRSSKRLRELAKGKPKVEDDSSDSGGGDEAAQSTPARPEDAADYDALPQEPDQLDDDEFQVYARLRAWRLRRKNELDVEPYKICQNRTLCELIRRKRNDAAFAKGDDDDGELRVVEDLLKVWGIGPSKAATGGFGWEMLEVLDADENVELLALSRENNVAGGSDRP